MRYHVFESGSKGNCTLISSKNKYLLIDNGLSRRKFLGYLSSVNVDLKDVNVVLVTHSHTDHTKGLDIFPLSCIYSSRTTTTLLDEQHVLTPYQTYYLNGFKITVLPTSHDVHESICFVIEDETEKLVYVTDTGFIYEKVLPYLKNATYYIFESNYDPRMELTSNRPQYLIDRVMSDKGHLSNEDASLYLTELISNETKEIVLAHISEEANTPVLALEAIKKISSKRRVNLEHVSIRCASQTEVTSGGRLEQEFNYVKS